MEHRKNKGFTLVELMVVVAMVGVLSAISMNSYKGFVIKARATEAKIALSAIYSAEKSFAAENGSYTACLANIGYSPEGSNRYFYVGFTALSHGTINSCGPNGTSDCLQVNWQAGGTNCTHDPKMDTGVDYAYPATASMPDASSPPPGAAPFASLIGGTTIDTSHFTVLAISNAPYYYSHNTHSNSLQYAQNIAVDSVTQVTDWLVPSAEASSRFLPPGPISCQMAKGFTINQDRTLQISSMLCI
ncbi:MAG: type IV pilin protein [Bdellovibrionia bacterium]